MIIKRAAVWEGKALFPGPGVTLVTFSPHSSLWVQHLMYTLLPGKMNGGSNLNRKQEGTQLPQAYLSKSTKIVHPEYLAFLLFPVPPPGPPPGSFLSLTSSGTESHH